MINENCRMSLNMSVVVWNKLYAFPNDVQLFTNQYTNVVITRYKSMVLVKIQE
jgi:hypothetical protein